MKTQPSTKSYKVGSVVLATDQGLGILAKSFYDAGIIDYVHIKSHSSRETHYDWYRENLTEDELLDRCDILIFFETPFNWKLIPKAREKGIKTVLMPMYECTNNPLPYIPDQVWCPSDLDMQYYKEYNPVRVQVPVEVPWKVRKEAKIFVHNAGNGGLGGRNGTKEVLEAMSYVKSPLKLIIRSQNTLIYKDNRVEVQNGTIPYEKLWDEGDVFLFPEKFNGLSLPMQEAYASGMLVMTSDRFPNNIYLPNDPLIPVSGYKKERIAVEFDSAIIDPKDIAKTMDEWYGRDITTYSEQGKQWGITNSWQQLKKTYRSMLENLLAERSSP
jgi:hypothetical protein